MLLTELDMISLPPRVHRILEQDTTPLLVATLYIHLSKNLLMLPLEEPFNKLFGFIDLSEIIIEWLHYASHFGKTPACIDNFFSEDN